MLFQRSVPCVCVVAAVVAKANFRVSLHLHLSIYVSVVQSTDYLGNFVVLLYCLHGFSCISVRAQSCPKCMIVKRDQKPFHIHESSNKLFIQEYINEFAINDAKTKLIV